MKMIRFSENDILVMKKTHPCGADRFKVRKTGSDVRIICLGCGRDTVVPRLKLEKGIRTVIASEENISETDSFLASSSDRSTRERKALSESRDSKK